MAPGDPGPSPCEAGPQAHLAEQAPRPEPTGAEPAGAETTGAEPAGAGAAICGPVEHSQKADPPPLTWQQQQTALLREEAEKKRRYSRYTDPRRCALRLQTRFID